MGRSPPQSLTVQELFRALQEALKAGVEIRNENEYLREEVLRLEATARDLRFHVQSLEAELAVRQVQVRGQMRGR